MLRLSSHRLKVLKLKTQILCLKKTTKTLRMLLIRCQIACNQNILKDPNPTTWKEMSQGLKQELGYLENDQNP